MNLVNAIQVALEAKPGAVASYDLTSRHHLKVETRNEHAVIQLSVKEADNWHGALYLSLDRYNCAKYAAVFAYYFYDGCKQELHNIFASKDIDIMRAQARDLMHQAFMKAKHVAWLDGNSRLEIALGNSEYLYFSVPLLVFYSDIVEQYKDDFEQWFTAPIADAIKFANTLKSISSVSAICEEQLDTKLRIKYRALLEQFIEHTEHEDLHECYNTLIASEQKCRESIVAGFKKSEPSFDDADVQACNKYVAANCDADLMVNEGLVTLAEAMYNWQAQNQVSFDLYTLSEILYTQLARLAEEEPEELSMDSDVQSALDLLRSQHWSEILDIAYIPPMYLMK